MKGRSKPSQTRVGAGFRKIHPQPDLVELIPLYKPELLESSSRHCLINEPSVEISHLTVSHPASDHSWLHHETSESSTSENLSDSELLDGIPVPSDEILPFISKINKSPTASLTYQSIRNSDSSSLMSISSHHKSLYGPCRYDCIVDCNQNNKNWNNSNALYFHRNVRFDEPDANLDGKFLRSKPSDREASSAESYQHCAGLSIRTNQKFRSSQGSTRECCQQSKLELPPMPNLPVLTDINFITDTRKKDREQASVCPHIIIKIPKDKGSLSSRLSSNQFEELQFRRRKTGTYIVLKRKAEGLGNCCHLLGYLIYPFWIIYWCLRVCFEYTKRGLTRRRHGFY